jgi:uncharacterized membrane protein
MYRRPARVYIYIIVLCVCVCALYTSATVYICIHKTTEKHGPVSARNGRLNARKAGEVFAPIFYFVVVVVCVCVCVCVFANSLRSQLFP